METRPNSPKLKVARKTYNFMKHTIDILFLKCLLFDNTFLTLVHFFNTYIDVSVFSSKAVSGAGLVPGLFYVHVFQHINCLFKFG